MNNRCPYSAKHRCELEIEHAVDQAALQEAEECFTLLRDDYHRLREHTDKLESILKDHNIDYPRFYVW